MNTQFPIQPACRKLKDTQVQSSIMTTMRVRTCRSCVVNTVLTRVCFTQTCKCFTVSECEIQIGMLCSWWNYHTRESVTAWVIPIHQVITWNETNRNLLYNTVAFLGLYLSRSRGHQLAAQLSVPGLYVTYHFYISVFPSVCTSGLIEVFLRSPFRGGMTQP